MIRNAFTIALRFMVQQRGFSVINLSGLTLGIASSLLILLYVIDELQYDRFHPDAARTFRVTQEGSVEGKRINSAYTGYPLAAALQRESADVASVAQLANWPTFPMRYEKRSFTEPNLLLADPGFFTFFNFRLIHGDPRKVLRGEGRLVLTESAARRYFNYTGPGDTSAIGKKMVLAQGYVATVTGIAADPPARSHFHFTAVLSLDSWTEAVNDTWTSGRVITYFKLRPEGRLHNVEATLRDFGDRYIFAEFKAQRNLDKDRFRHDGNNLQFGLQPLTSIHLQSSLTDEIEPNGDLQYVYLFIAIAVFITLLACINFMNLSTARSASRAKEVGVRKAVGASNQRLMVQFLFESYFYIIVAVLIALFIIMIAIGPFNALVQKQLDTASFLTAPFLLGIGAFIVVVGLLAGSYPAFYLIRFTPIDVLKGRVRRRLRSYGIRNALVVFQFFISSALIIATLTAYEQLRFVQQAQIGFDKENLINLIHTANLGTNGTAFKKELLRSPGIISASYANRLPPNIDWEYLFRPVPGERDYILNVYEVDYDHLKTMKYSMIKGRFFSRELASDTNAVILNETAAQRMKLTTLAGRKVTSDYGVPAGMEREVIGIVSDFHFQPLRDSIQPIAMVLGNEPNWEMAVRIAPGMEEAALLAIRQLWQRYAPNAPFEYSFLDQNFRKNLNTERRVALLFLLFTLLAVLIACLGLFGLATFTAEQRIKEIGIRKVLGASVGNIVLMLNKDFLKLVLLANLAAWPVAGYLMNRWWLSQFAYHISVSWWVFAVAGLITFAIAFFSISTRAFSAAKGDPVNSLRDE